ncbi:uncharacterized membrane protein (DUF485 family) [Anaerosolibacter carboniphilus]|uniref:Uncharacterized membrane protein (DUF485 family) n=1 Tax=Anaerosolibacter carboniphilus TaxID=1417629 RepID=A0A841KQ12_9FIRM|nr:hypothetical protein [Anaerosolibacter carboniphilus]MBB6215513.1 uncharacterized membrane protein (DUF485 family) [Anaerosolibacter carboniphilus]
MKYFKMLYISFLWSVLFSVICFQSEWLEMRVNIGLLGFVMMVVFMLAGVLLDNKKGTMNDLLNMKFVFVNLVLSFGCMLLLLGLERIYVLPAAIIREGLHIRGVSFAAINSLILSFLVLGAGAMVFSENIQRKSTRDSRILFK